MPNGDPRDGFFYPTIKIMIDSYNNNRLNKTVTMLKLQFNNNYRNN